MVTQAYIQSGIKVYTFVYPLCMYQQTLQHK